MSINRSSPGALTLKNTGDQGGVEVRKQGVGMEEIVPVSHYTPLQWLTACPSVCLTDDSYLSAISVLNEGEKISYFPQKTEEDLLEEECWYETVLRPL